MRDGICRIVTIMVFVVALIILGFGTARADLNAYIHDLNAAAQTDLDHYRAQLGARFGIGDAELDLVYRTVNGNGEVAVLLWLKERCGLPLDVVLGRYQEHKGQGWGALAQSLGIKPGSDAFHRLKAGDLGWYPEGSGGGKGKDSGKGKPDKGSGPDKGNGKPGSKGGYHRY